MALALDYLHSKEIIHRNLTSLNILVANNGNIKITDFGFSELTQSRRCLKWDYHLSYVSPEIVKGQTYESKTDIWALGCMMHHLTSLTFPFNGSNPIGIANNIKNFNITKLPEVYPKNVYEFIK